MVIIIIIIIIKHVPEHVPCLFQGNIWVCSDMGKFVALVLVSAVFVLCFLWYTSTACFGTSLCGGEALEGQSAVTPGRTLQNDTVDNAHTTQKTLLSNVNRSVNEVTEKISEKLGRAETIPRNKTKKTCRRSRKGKGHVEKQQESNVTNAGSAIRKYHLETEPTPGDKHIMFIETSCLLDSSQNSKYPGLVLNKRQVCAIESAAKMNPRHKVYLLHSCPICGRLEDSSEHVQTLFTYPNVYLWKLDRKRHFSKTPLEKWNFQSAIKTSLWPKEHSSDVLRFLTLWKYGGTYLDLDFVILKWESQCVDQWFPKNPSFRVPNELKKFWWPQYINSCTLHSLN